MGTKKVHLDIDGEKLRALIGSRESFSERAAKFGVTKQALNNWMTEGSMPPRAIAELVLDLGLGVEDITALLRPQSEKMNKKKWVVTLTIEAKP